MKDEYNKSVVFASQDSFFNNTNTMTKSKIQNCELTSSVFTITNKPAIARLASTPAIKALFTPLPEIPRNNQPSSPASSITLDKLIEKRICTTGKYR
jgi:hypothetical protein